MFLSFARYEWARPKMRNEGAGTCQKMRKNMLGLPSEKEN